MIISYLWADPFSLRDNGSITQRNDMCLGLGDPLLYIRLFNMHVFNLFIISAFISFSFVRFMYD